MSHGLRFRAAGRRAGCSHQAISNAVADKRIPLQADGTVAPADVDEWNRNRRAPRGGSPWKVTGNTDGPAAGRASRFQEISDARPGSIAFGAPEAIVDLAYTVSSGAWSMAPILLRHLQRQAAEAVLQEWLADRRRELVGGPGCTFAPTCVEDWWPNPPAGGEWHEHALFTEPAIAEAEWEYAAEEAAAWRAAQGLAPLQDVPPAGGTDAAT